MVKSPSGRKPLKQLSYRVYCDKCHLEEIVHPPFHNGEPTLHITEFKWVTENAYECPNCLDLVDGLDILESEEKKYLKDNSKKLYGYNLDEFTLDGVTEKKKNINMDLEVLQVDHTNNSHLNYLDAIHTICLRFLLFCAPSKVTTNITQN